MPQNFLIAHKKENRFIFDLDLKVEKTLATKVYETSHCFEMIWGGGEQVAKKLNELLTVVEN